MNRSLKYNYDQELKDLLDNESFQKWVLGQTTEDHDYWTAWVGSDSDRLSLVHQASIILYGPGFKIKESVIPVGLIESEWKRLEAKIIATPSSSKRRVIRLIPVNIIGLAAAVLVALAIGIFLLDNSNEYRNTVYRTAYGEQKHIILPDSTVIELNANSELCFVTGRPREVWLQGEAYFQVRKKPVTGENFRVFTNDLTVEVLGTVFNIVDSEEETQVVLEEGSVKLNLHEQNHPELLMEPGEMVAYSVLSRSPPRRERVEPHKVTSWKDGVLIFEDASLDSVMQRINDIYGYQWEYQSMDLSNRRVSMPLPINDMDQALTLLKKAIGVEITKEGDNLLRLE